MIIFSRNICGHELRLDDLASDAFFLNTVPPMLRPKKVYNERLSFVADYLIFINPIMTLS